jgi:hypothetical protein
VRTQNAERIAVAALYDRIDITGQHVKLPS